MKIIYNSIIPFKGYLAINLFGVLFARKEYRKTIEESSKYQTILINHESIHTAQIKELWYIFFYIIYVFEWLYRILFTKDRFSTSKSYRAISFEKEAYDNEKNLLYLQNRKHFAMWKRK